MREYELFFIWATPILLNISRESFFILFTYAQKPIPNAQIDNEVFTSGAPLYIVSVTAVGNLKTLKTLKMILGTCWTTFVFMSMLKNGIYVKCQDWAVLLILVQWSHDTSIFIKLGYEMYWKEKPISSEFSKRIQSSGKQRQASICPIRNL